MIAGRSLGLGLGASLLCDGLSISIENRRLWRLFVDARWLREVVGLGKSGRKGKMDGRKGEWESRRLEGRSKRGERSDGGHEMRRQ